MPSWEREYSKWKEFALFGEGILLMERICSLGRWAALNGNCPHEGGNTLNGKNFHGAILKGKNLPPWEKGHFKWKEFAQLGGGIL